MNDYVKAGTIYRVFAGLIAAIGRLGLAGAFVSSATGEFSLSNADFVIINRLIPVVL
jgi:hypothetical protein